MVELAMPHHPEEIGLWVTVEIDEPIGAEISVGMRFDENAVAPQEPFDALDLQQSASRSCKH